MTKQEYINSIKGMGICKISEKELKRMSKEDVVFIHNLNFREFAK